VKGHKNKAISNRSPSAAIRLSRKRTAEITRQVWQLAEPVCAAQGLELIHVEFQSEARGRILRLYIDKAGGVTLNDCADLSRQLGDLLDVSLEKLGSYSLEVSSPGAERPLGRISDFDRFSGQTVKIRTFDPINDQKNFTGVLTGISQGLVTLSMGDSTVAIPYEDINKARLVNHGEDGCLSQISNASSNR
jgi:ribosome maturation factor RimP